MDSAEEFYIQWCLEQQPEYEDMIREHAKNDGMQEIFGIMEQYNDHMLDELQTQLETNIKFHKKILKDCPQSDMGYIKGEIRGMEYSVELIKEMKDAY